MMNWEEVSTIAGGCFGDDRGHMKFFNDVDFSMFKRSYVIYHERPYIRAWHGHVGEGKLVQVINGTFLVGVAKLAGQELIMKTVLSDREAKLLWIPPGHANGFKNLTQGGSIIFYSTSTLEESKDDDIRFPYDKWNIWEDDYR